MKDKHAEAFRQEAFELLEVLESSLIELETEPDDQELISKVFRSLHTIKGSAGMFGFEGVASLVHDIETVYDRIRNNELKVSPDIIEHTLKACDQLTIMISNDMKGALVENDAVSEIINFFLNFKKEAAASGPVKKENKADEPADITCQDGKKLYHIIFVPAEDLFLKGVRPTGLLKELSELGDAVIIPDTEKVPLLDTINPEKLNTSWNIFLSTDKGINQIKDVFIFVEDECEIKINIIDSGELKGGAEYYSDILKQKRSEKPQGISSVKAKSQGEDKKVKEKAAKDSVASIRVSSEKLDQLVNLVGELVTVQARLTELAAVNNSADITSVSEDVERLTWELRENALSIRMLPIGSTFNKYVRLVRDLSRDLGKEVELVTDGGETELDKNVIEKLNDPLVHIIRNSIDHGIESPEDREKAGKLRTGQIFLSAMHSGTHVIITITDDGAGLNKDAILAKAVERGLITPDTVLEDKEIFKLIFKPGFSTAKTVTNVSGRGVGMDVVRTAVESLRGMIEVESKPGEGSSIILKLPLTLAIIEGLIIRVDKDYFVIPLSYVEECLELTSEVKKRSNGRNLLNVRNEIIPYIPLREKFSIHNNQPDIEQVVVIRENNLKTGLVVDEIIGEHQTVIKTLGKYYSHVEVMSGATVLGNGTVALIIDVPKLVQEVVREEELLIQ